MQLHILLFLLPARAIAAALSNHNSHEHGPQMTVNVVKYSTTDCSKSFPIGEGGGAREVKINHCRTWWGANPFTSFKVNVVESRLGKSPGEKKWSELLKDNWCYLYAYPSNRCLGESVRSTEFSEGQGLCEAMEIMAQSVKVVCEQKSMAKKLPPTTESRGRYPEDNDRGFD